MDTKKIKPNYFSTFFMFPFGFESDVDGVIAKFQKSSKWIAEKYQIKKGLDYNEYVYFYKYVRDILLETQQHTDDKKEGVKFFRYNFENHCLQYEVYNQNIDKEKPISLKIEEINLHLFEPGVGILIFEIVNEEKESPLNLSLYDYLAFLTNGRRVFPPFINPESERENGTFKCGFTKEDAINKKECAAQISITCGKDTIVKEDYKQNFHLIQYSNQKQTEVLPYLSKIIRHFLDLGDEFNYAQKQYWPIIDDRMFCHTYYGIVGDSKTYNKPFLDNLKRALNSEEPKPYTDDALRIWHQLIFLDLEGPSCANRPFMIQQINESSYNRWSDWGTFYGFTRYSSTTISDYDVKFINNHFKTMYYQIAVLLFFYRGALLSFSNKSAAIASQIQSDAQWNVKKKHKKNNRRNQNNKIVQELEELNREFLLFRNKLWFREVTAQEQGIEMFDIMTEKMRNIELLEDLQIEIKELYAYFDAQREKETAKTINTLTILGAIFMPLIIATALFGMNFPFDVCSYFQSTNSIVKFASSTLILLLTWTVLSLVFITMAKVFSKIDISDLLNSRK